MATSSVACLPARATVALRGTGAKAATPKAAVARPTARKAAVIAARAFEGESSLSRREAIVKAPISAGAAALAAQGVAVSPALAESDLLSSKSWTQVDLGLEPGVILLDIEFVPDDPKHGFILGTRQTVLETVDGGKTWNPRYLGQTEDEGVNYRFNSISFAGSEGWIVGKPAILYHTTDGGKTWERIPLSARLPGNPVLVTALPEKGSCEMATDEGALYVTSNAAYTWRAAVEETVSATLNRTVSSGISGASYYTGSFASIHRSSLGEYVGVTSRGNFYMTWEPGQTYWQPHNRNSSRRIQNMGWRNDDGLWLISRGGELYFGKGQGVVDGDDFEQRRIGARGFGILDVAFRSKKEAWAVGGSGSVFQSLDGGNSWKREKTLDNLAANLYTVKFVDGGKNGFVLGNDGVLLRFIGA